MLCKHFPGKPAGGTSRDFVHGADITLTRRNIERERARVAEYGDFALTAEALVESFIRFPKARHWNRVDKLMAR